MDDHILEFVRLHVQMAAMLVRHAHVLLSFDILISFRILISLTFSSVGSGQAQGWGTTLLTTLFRRRSFGFRDLATDKPRLPLFAS
jgi:hypothetical protein